MPERDITDNPAPEEKKGPGRPRRTDWQETFLEQYALHGIQVQAARSCHVDPGTVDDERKRNPDFDQRYRDAYAQSNGALELGAFTWARGGLVLQKTRTTTKTVKGKGGEPDVVETTTSVEDSLERSPGLTIFMLKNRMPDRYGDRLRIDESSTVNVTVHGEEADVATGAFNAAVVRLADHRRAGGSDQRSGTG